MKLVISAKIQPEDRFSRDVAHFILSVSGSQMRSITKANKQMRQAIAPGIRYGKL